MKLIFISFRKTISCDLFVDLLNIILINIYLIFLIQIINKFKILYGKQNGTLAKAKKVIIYNLSFKNRHKKVKNKKKQKKLLKEDC